MFNGMKLFFCFGAFLMTTGCATVSLEDQKPDTGGIIFNKPIATVHSAAENAFIVNGLEIIRSSPNYIEGLKPSAGFSIFARHGGENFAVWLEAISASKTCVHTKTLKNMQGGLVGKTWGQKCWDESVLGEMKVSLK